MLNRRTSVILLLLGLSSVPAPAQQVSDFVCLTPQVTRYDRESRLRIVDFSSSRNKQNITDFSNNGTRAVTIEDFQLLYGKNAWTKSDSLPGGDGKIRIGVAFLDGDEAQKAAVIKYASEWLVPAGATNIEFVWNSRERNHIRVTFNADRNDNRSAIGRQATQLADHAQPTMYLAAVGKEPSERVAEVVRHEFGHALGMRHEHQHPNSKIEWNKSVVEAYFAQFGWTKAMVKTQIFDLLDVSYKCRGADQFDENSIMMYPVEPGWAKNFVRDVQKNTEIIPADFACVHSLYQ